MLLAVSAQKPRPAGSDRCASLKRRRDSLFHARRACQPKIIIRYKIDTRTRLEVPQPLIVFQGIQGCDIAGKLIRMGWFHCSLSGKPSVAQNFFDGH